jgi:hypothetical protein
MGLKGFDINNKNMLGQTAAEYAYRVDDTGNILASLGGSVTRWKSAWNNYRVYNSSTGVFDDGTEGPDVWRKHDSFQFLGDYSKLRSDGLLTYLASDRFDFNPASANAGWRKTGSIDRYDHNSYVLQTTDDNNLSSSGKLSGNGAVKIADASNAKYHEIAFTSCEDVDPNNSSYFGGEVGLGSGMIDGTAAHTGSYSVLLLAGKSLIYKANSLQSNRRYKASVWTNNLSGRIYYKVNGGTEELSAAPTDVTKVGNWYRVNVEIPSQTSAFSIEVGVKNVGGSSVLFDDLRFQPFDSSLTGYVYDKDTGALTYVLDNDNLFTRYEYNDKGQVIRTYVESFKYGVKKVSESSNDYRRSHIDQ